MSFAQRSWALNRRPLLQGVMGAQTQRNISLLINDQFLDEDQKMIQ